MFSSIRQAVLSKFNYLLPSLYHDSKTFVLILYDPFEYASTIMFELDSRSNWAKQMMYGKGYCMLNKLLTFVAVFIERTTGMG